MVSPPHPIRPRSLVKGCVCEMKGGLGTKPLERIKPTGDMVTIVNWLNGFGPYASCLKVRKAWVHKPVLLFINLGRVPLHNQPYERNLFHQYFINTFKKTETAMKLSMG